MVDTKPVPRKPAGRATLHGLPTPGKLSQRKQLNNVGAETQRLRAIIEGEDGKSGVIGLLNELIEKHNQEVGRLSRVVVRSQVHERILVEYAHRHLEAGDTSRLRRWFMGVVHAFIAPLTRPQIDAYVKERVAELQADEERRQAAEAAKAGEPVVPTDGKEPVPPAA